jgi:HAMP domain-containing protein
MPRLGNGIMPPGRSKESSLHKKFTPGMPFVLSTLLIDMIGFGIIIPVMPGLIQELTAQMHQAAGDLHFELAARIRDEIGDLKKELRQMSEATK